MMRPGNGHLTPTLREQIAGALAQKVPMGEIAKTFGTTYRTVQRIKQIPRHPIGKDAERVRRNKLSRQCEEINAIQDFAARRAAQLHLAEQLRREA